MKQAVAAAELKSPPKKRFLKYIHYFRAIAIVNIIFSHTLDITLQVPNAAAEQLSIFREVLFHGSTLYFLIISGFLFQFLAPKFTLRGHLKKKFANVIMPYLILSTSIMVYRYSGHLYSGKVSVAEFSRLLQETLLLGNISIQYWYIPFIAVVYLFSPLFLKLSKKQLKRTALLSCLLPLVVSRTGSEVTAAQFVYFVPVFILGMHIANNLDGTLAFIRKQRFALILISGISTIILFYLEAAPLQALHINLTESLFFIQKISLSLLLLHFSYLIRNWKSPSLSLIADYSFALYFLHIFIDRYAVRAMFFEWINTKAPFLLAPSAFLFSCYVFLATLLATAVIKKLLKKYSRYVIGA
ncbi:MAG: acyltransferase [Cytophagales bacterium]|nr:acyltransferase [Cytophagales bacterium]